MDLANAGDGDAYRDLMLDLGGVVEAYLRARFGELPFLEDCVQECLLAVHRARGSYDPSRAFRPWLFTIVRHKTIDLLRRGQTRERVVADSDRLAREPAAMHDPAAGMEGARILARLEPKYREALSLTKLAGYTLPEAAEHAGVSTTAMKTRVHRALRSVRKLLEREDVS
jgi:RNA polymerase sigma-70 factor (ECF subfamily)